MIRDALTKDKEEILAVWKSAYPTKADSFLDLFFHERFDQGKCILVEQDGRIVSTLQYHEESMAFSKRLLSIAYLHNLGTIPDYRKRGHMRKLMDATLDEVNHNYMLSIMEAYNPRIYEPFGFEVIYYQKHYNVRPQHLEKVNTVGIEINVKAEDLLELYLRYTKHFDGYLTRDEAYFEQLIECSKLSNYGLCAYLSPHNQIDGYAFYEIVHNEVVIKEIIYMESIALLKLMKQVIGNHSNMEVIVSQSEKLEKVIPLLIPKKMSYMMARINNYDLFNKLYNVEVKNVKEAYTLLNKPKFLNLFY
ncbi:MAG: GNAT family N-acetyltransferase [Erysipelotrichaceae bacterium]